jgi:hypothetical protein
MTEAADLTTLLEGLSATDIEFALLTVASVTLVGQP